MSGAGTLEPRLAGDPRSRVHRLDPRAKIVGLLGVTVVAVSTPLDALAGLRRLRGSCSPRARRSRACGRRELWRRVRVVLPLVLLVGVLVPFVRTAARARVGR